MSTKNMSTKKMSTDKTKKVKIVVNDKLTSPGTLTGLRSMTGYGFSKGSGLLFDLEISVRTVNGRYFEPRMHLPKEYYFFESEIKKVLTKYFSRGTIDIVISRKKKTSTDHADVRVNIELAKKYSASFLNLAKVLKLAPDIKLRDLVTLPDVIQAEIVSEIQSEEQETVIETLSKACLACATERWREGMGLKADLLFLIQQLESELEFIELHREEVNATLVEKTKAKLLARISDIQLDPARITQEVLMMLEKSDISEEVSRLREHTRNFQDILSQQIVFGKKLDFYTQELLREVNTVGSKTQIAKVTQKVVESKLIVERIREQVQNVE